MKFLPGEKWVFVTHKDGVRLKPSDFIMSNQTYITDLDDVANFQLAPCMSGNKTPHSRDLSCEQNVVFDFTDSHQCALSEGDNDYSYQAYEWLLLL